MARWAKANERDKSAHGAKIYSMVIINKEKNKIQLIKKLWTINKTTELWIEKNLHIKDWP